MSASDEKAALAAEEVYRPPYLGALLAGLGVFLLYTLTLAPTTAFWDTSEYIATAHILGIPHPPGNPLFVVLARTWDILLTPLGLSVAVRINLFSAVQSALAHAFWFLLAHRILAYFSTNRWFRLLGATAAVLLSATAFTVWNQSNVNEKVYTVSLFTIALLSWLAFRWRDHIGEGKDDNLLLLMVFILALSVGNHLMAFLAAPALFVYIVIVRWRTLLNWRLYATAVVAAILGLSIHLFLPIRADLSPVINEADPTCETMSSAVVSVVTMGRAGCPALSESLSRTQYDKPSVMANPLDPTLPRDARFFTRQILNYAQYFDWQWARSVAGNLSWFGGLRPVLTLLFVFLGLFGAYAHWQKDRPSWLYVAILFLTLSLGLTFYLNFKYGYTLPESLMRRDFLAAVQGNTQDLTEVRERDYFFIVSFSIWGLWAGIGIAALWQGLSAWYEQRGSARPLVAASPLLALACLPLVLNWTWASRRNDYTARDWAYNLLMSVEPYGIVFTNGDNDTFPLWYAQEVEGIRKDVTVMVMSYLNTPWYVRQIRQLTTPCAPGQDPASDPTRIICQRPFDPAQGAGLYSAMMTTADTPEGAAAAAPGHRPPTRSIVPLTDAEIEQVSNTPPYRLPDDREFAAGAIRTTLPQNDIIIPSDAFMALMIQTAIEDRPVYYAMTTQAYDELRLRPFLIRQGVAFKLNDGPVQVDSARGIIPVPETRGLLMGSYIDLPRTEKLVSDVFQFRGNFPNWGHWVDSATQGIPFYYGITEYGLMLVYQGLGDTAAANRHGFRANEFLALGNKRSDAVEAASR